MNVNTKILMTASAVIMGVVGLLFIFIPAEIAHYFNLTPSIINILVLQTLGALYFSFAVLNWMGKANLIGGIYGKPVSMGNFAHFFIVSITIIKFVFSHQTSIILWVTAFIYIIFAILFGTVAFGNPVKTNRIF